MKTASEMLRSIIREVEDDLPVRDTFGDDAALRKFQKYEDDQLYELQLLALKLQQFALEARTEGGIRNAAYQVVR